MIHFNNVRRTSTALLILTTIVLVPSIMIMGIVLLLKPKDSNYPDCFFNSHKPGCYSQTKEDDKGGPDFPIPFYSDDKGGPDFPIPFYSGVLGF